METTSFTYWRGKFRSFAAMIRYAQMHKQPVTGNFAAMIWELFSSERYFNPTFAQKMYLAMGYKPFAGYPLSRKTK